MIRGEKDVLFFQAFVEESKELAFIKGFTHAETFPEVVKSPVKEFPGGFREGEVDAPVDSPFHVFFTGSTSCHINIFQVFEHGQEDTGKAVYLQKDVFFFQLLVDGINYLFERELLLGGSHVVPIVDKGTIYDAPRGFREGEVDAVVDR